MHDDCPAEDAVRPAVADRDAANHKAELRDPFVIKCDVAQVTGMTLGLVGAAMFVFARIEVAAGIHCLSIAAVAFVMDMDAFRALGMATDFTAHAHDVCTGLGEGHGTDDLAAAARLQLGRPDRVQLGRAGTAGGEDDKGCGDGNALHWVISFGAP